MDDGMMTRERGLIDVCRDYSDYDLARTRKIRVMVYTGNLWMDAGTVVKLIGEPEDITAGAAQGPDSWRGAYEWWPIYHDGEHVGELYDDASGLTIMLDPPGGSVADAIGAPE